MQNNRIPKLLYNWLHSVSASEAKKNEYNSCFQIKTFLIELNYITILENESINKKKIQEIIPKYKTITNEKEINQCQISKFNTLYNQIKISVAT